MYLFSSSTTKFLHSQPPIKIPIQKRSNNLNFNQYRRNLRPFSRQPYAFFRKSDSNPTDKVRDSNVNSAEEDFVSRVLNENPLQPYAFFRKSDSNPTDKVRDSDVNLEEEDFVSRVLKENPCEVEPKYLIGGKLYSKEKKIPKKEKEKEMEKEKEKGKDLLEVKEKGEDLLKVKVKEKEKEKEKEKGNDLLEVKEKEKEKGEDLFEVKEKEEKDPFEVKEKGEDLFEVKEKEKEKDLFEVKEKDLFEVKEKGDNLFEVKEKREDHFEVNEKGEDEKRWDFGDVKLKDMLKDFRGKVYVPEQAFGETLSEEEEFNRSFRSLPKMEFENFMEALGEGRIRFMTYKDDIGDGLIEFIFELDDIPTQNDIKSMQRTKWAMMLNENQAKDALDEYNGPRYMIETQLSKRAATALFHDMIHKEIEVYVDDMIIHSKGADGQHFVDLQKFFERLRKHSMRLNPAKCTFGVTRGKVLGYMVTVREIEADPRKIKVIMDKKPPRSQTEVKKLYGQTAVHQPFR